MSSPGTRRVGVDGALLSRLDGVCEEITTDEAETAAAATDRWSSAPADLAEWARPAVVARPADEDQVAAVLAACSDVGVPVTPAGGRSGVCGGSVPVHGGVSLDLRRLSGDPEVDDESLVADVPAGTLGDTLEASLRAVGLTLGHWPQSLAISTVGGWLACRSAGQYSTRYGKIEDLAAGLRVALADGRVVRTGAGPRSAVGPDLTQLFVGSEGTLGVITSARLRLRPAPAEQRCAVYGFATFAAGLDACRRILRRWATPAALRLYDAPEARLAFGQADGPLLVVVDEADPVVLDASMRIVDEECSAVAGGGRRLDDGPAHTWLATRARLSTFAEYGLVGDTIEVAAPWSSMSALYDDMCHAVGHVHHVEWVSAHQSHAYADGACIYLTFAGVAPDDGTTFTVEAWDAAVAAARRHGANLSHHHGIGMAKSRYVAEALGSAFTVLSALKDALDPTGILNPGKLGLPDPFGPVGWS